jgi:hypothetical protein
MTVAVMSQINWSLSFRRWLHESLQDRLRRMRDAISSFALSDENDFSKWVWEKNRNFSAKLMYAQFGARETEKQYKYIWKAKIPLKIKIFLWLGQENSILSKITS